MAASDFSCNFFGILASGLEQCESSIFYINKRQRPKYGCSTITPERLRRSQQMWSHFKALNFLQITEGLKLAVSQNLSAVKGSKIVNLQEMVCFSVKSTEIRGGRSNGKIQAYFMMQPDFFQHFS